jgi:hypothetical protein
MSEREFAETISDRVGPCDYGQTIEVSTNVIRECSHRGIPAFRIFVQGLEADDVEIPG